MATWTAALALACLASGCAHSTERRQHPTCGTHDESEIEAEDDSEPTARAHVTRGPKKRIGVVDFGDTSRYANGGRPEALAAAARNIMVATLARTGAFVVVDREQIAHAMQLNGLARPAVVDAQAAARVSKVLGLQAFVTGTVTSFNAVEQADGIAFHAEVHLQVIDAMSGAIWIEENGIGTATKQTSGLQQIGRHALELAIESPMQRIRASTDARAWAGSIIRTSHARLVYIDAGAETRLPVGALLTVHAPDNSIIGKLELLEHTDGQRSACISTKGAGFAIGDVVTLDE